MHSKKTYFEKAVAIAAALLVWQIAAMLLNQQILLASPVSVAKTLFVFITQAEFWRTIGVSFSRILLGFLIGFLAGVIAAILSARFHIVEMLLWPYMAAVKATPVASFIILCLVWFQAGSTPVFVCFLIVLPVVYTNLLNGIKNLDSQMTEMADIFQLKPMKKLLAIYMPQLYSYVIAAFEIAIGMAWKAGIAAEVIGIPAGSIGKMIYYAKIYLETSELFAWSFMVVLVSVIFEKLAVILVKRFYKRLEKLV